MNFQAIVEHREVDTHVGGLLLLPCDIVVHEGRNGRTGYRTVAEAVSHVVTVHGSHILVLTDVLVTELTIAGTNLEHVNDVAADWEELFLIEAPAQRYRWEGCPTDVLAQAGATITTYYCRNQVLLSIVIVQTAYV